MKPILFFFTLLVISSCSYNITQHNNISYLSKKGVNFYLIKEKDRYLMIDCGTPNQGKQIEKTLIKHDIDPKKVSHLILTHTHYDHAGNAQYFKDKFGTKIIVGKGDLEMIKNKGIDPHLCSTSFMAKMGLLFIKNIQYNSFTPDVLIDDEYNLSNIGFSGKITPLPGHTSGSLIIETNNSLFVGDLIRGSILNNTQPKKHFFMCNLDDNHQQIKKILKTTNHKIWYVGHGGPLPTNAILEFLKTQ